MSFLNGELSPREILCKLETDEAFKQQVMDRCKRGKNSVLEYVRENCRGILPYKEQYREHYDGFTDIPENCMLILKIGLVMANLFDKFEELRPLVEEKEEQGGKEKEEDFESEASEESEESEELDSWEEEGDEYVDEGEGEHEQEYDFGEEDMDMDVPQVTSAPRGKMIVRTQTVSDVTVFPTLYLGREKMNDLKAGERIDNVKISNDAKSRCIALVQMANGKYMRCANVRQKERCTRHMACKKYAGCLYCSNHHRAYLRRDSLACVMEKICKQAAGRITFTCFLPSVKGGPCIQCAKKVGNK